MEREKLTVTIARDLFSQIDSVIDGETIRNRSHATEYLIRQGLGQHRVRSALILAGGRGTRLRPLTLELPKPMIPVQGQPLLAHTLKLLAQHNVRNIIISLGYKGDQIKHYFGDGRAFDVSIRYVQEKEPLGTAGPLHLAQPLLSETFLLLNGDVLSDIDLTSLVQHHRSLKGVATLALVSVKDPEHYGAAKLQGSQITEFVEKPEKGQQPTNFINAGFTVCEPTIFEHVGPGKQMLEADVYPTLSQTGRLMAYPFAGQWFHIGTAAQYEQALQDWRPVP